MPFWLHIGKAWPFRTAGRATSAGNRELIADSLWKDFQAERYVSGLGAFINIGTGSAPSTGQLAHSMASSR